MAEDVGCERFSFTKKTDGTGSQVISLSTSKTPKAVIFTCNRVTGSGGSYLDGYHMCIGWDDGSTRAVEAIKDADNLTSGLAKPLYHIRNDACILLLDEAADNTIDASATVSSFGSGSITLNWGTNDSDANIVHGIAFFGDDLQAKVLNHIHDGNFGDEAITGSGFQPEIAFGFGGDEEMTGWNSSETAGGMLNIGCAVSSSKQWAVAVAIDDSRFIQNNKWFSDSHFIYEVDSDSQSIDTGHTLKSFDSDGLTITSNSFTEEPIPMSFLVMEGGSWDVGSFTINTSTGNQTISTDNNTGTIQGIGLFSSQNVDGGLSSTTAEAPLAIGLISKAGETITEGCLLSNSTHSSGTQGVKSHDTDKALRMTTVHATASSSTTLMLCDCTDMSKQDEFTLNLTTASSGTRLVGWFTVSAGADPPILVSQTNIHKYNISQYTSNTNIHKYNILNFVIQSNVNKYNILQYILQSSIHKYDMIAYVLSNSIQKYNVLEYVIQNTIQKYHILNNVIQNSIQKYHIFENILANSIHKYDIIAYVIQSSIQKYHIFENIIQTSIQKYHILNNVLQSSIQKYDILNNVIQESIHKYDMFANVIANSIQKYDIIAYTLSTSIHKYNILQNVIANSIHKYDIISQQLVLQTSIQKYHIFENVVQSNIQKYNIFQNVIQSSIHKYDIIAYVLSNSIHKYDIFQYISQNTIQKYNILNNILQSSIHKYNILENILQTTIHKYNMSGIVSAANIHKYNIITYVTQTNIHKYYILNDIIQTSIHKYNIFNNVLQSSIHKYNLFAYVSGASIQKYNILNIIIQNNIQKYNILNTISQNTVHKYNIFQNTIQQTIHKYDIRQFISQNTIHKYKIGILGKKLISVFGTGKRIETDTPSRTLQDFLKDNFPW